MRFTHFILGHCFMCHFNSLGRIHPASWCRPTVRTSGDWGEIIIFPTNNSKRWHATDLCGLESMLIKQNLMHYKLIILINNLILGMFALGHKIKKNIEYRTIWAKRGFARDDALAPKGDYQTPTLCDSSPFAEVREQFSSALQGVIFIWHGPGTGSWGWWWSWGWGRPGGLGCRRGRSCFGNRAGVNTLQKNTK